MKLGKSMESMVKDVSTQVGKRIEAIDLESLLASFGLQLLERRRRIAWPLAAAFGTGMIVGALVTPMSGGELRRRIADLSRRLTGSTGGRELTTDGKPVASPYDEARTERDERSSTTRSAAKRGTVQAMDPGPHLSSAT
jgi:hypothetical protein